MVNYLTDFLSLILRALMSEISKAQCATAKLLIEVSTRGSEVITQSASARVAGSLKPPMTGATLIFSLRVSKFSVKNTVTQILSFSVDRC